MSLRELMSGNFIATGRSGLKRLLDLCFVLATLPLTLPMMVVIIVAIRLTSPGPAILRLTCVGMDGVPFRQYRFRIIHSDLTAGDLASGVAAKDRCLTRVGAMLLPSGLNRLPQLFNVIKGEMSVIGPHAVSLATIDRHGKPDARLFAARPGIVPPELFLPPGQAISDNERMALSLAYATNAGALTDGRLVLQSASRMLRRR